jgi:RNA polymerase sigma-70 factor (ECF subfamily)
MFGSRLVAEARKGNPEAFARLVRHHSDVVYFVALRIMRDEEARDASQEAWMRAWRGLERFKGESAFTTWLYRIAVNACPNYRRGRHSGEHVELRDETLYLPDTSGDGDRRPVYRTARWWRKSSFACGRSEPSTGQLSSCATSRVWVSLR